MSGDGIIGALLYGDAGVTALVPIERIKAEVLPDNIGLPALVVTSISITDNQWLTQGPLVRSTERVAVTVRAASVRDRTAVLKAVRRACAGFTGSIHGATGVSVRTAGAGPALTGPGNSFERTQDFSVSYEVSL